MDAGFQAQQHRAVSRAGAAAVVTAAAFTLLTLALIGGPLPRLDERVRHWAIVNQNPSARRLATDVRWFGDVRTAGIALVVVSAVVVSRLRRWLLVALALAIAGLTAAAVESLKLAVGRSEAPVAVHAALGTGGHGYPSGHVAAATVCCGLVAVMVGTAAPRMRAGAAAAATLVVLLVCWSVVYGPSHWLTDAIGGVLIGVAALAAFVALERRTLSRRRHL